MPALRIAPGVKACDDKDSLIDDAKKQSIRESAKLRSAHVFQHEGELQRVIGDARDDSVDLANKTPSQDFRMRSVPMGCFEHLSPGARAEDDGKHYGRRVGSSALSCSHGTPWARSASKRAKRCSSSASCAGVKGTSASVRLSQSSLIRASRC
jgi:hypothetical protein